ncbi:hypothetical protein SOVF_007120 [Spinacia oleracea]|nr:hypothetical protein SOVF_007120 [Spinacia oleracea]
MLSQLQHNLLMTSQQRLLNLVDMLLLLLVHLVLMEKPYLPSLNLVIHRMMHPSKRTLHHDNLIQITTYCLLSSASSAIPITNRMREGADNIFTDSSAAAISMSLLAFISLVAILCLLI